MPPANAIAFAIRKTALLVEAVHHEGGPPPARPLRIAVASALVSNPFAGRYEPDLLQGLEPLKVIGRQLAEMLVGALGREAIEAYGKGAIVGEDGELEHGALWHEAGGWSLRALLGEPKAIVPSAMTLGTLGMRLMIPLGHIHAAYVRSHFSVADLSCADGPRRGEILFGLAAATGERPHARVGGLLARDVKGSDGLR